MDADELEKGFQKLVQDMPDATKEHFKNVIVALLACYLEDGPSCVILMGKEGGDELGFITINANVMDAHNLVAKGFDASNKLNMVDAPPKEQYN